MKSGACVLFEGRYAEGAAALVNSLHRSGYRGAIYAGHRGSPPEWLNRARSAELGGLDLIPVPFERGGPLTWQKPAFVERVWSGPARDCEVLFYFDSDLFVTGSWSLFETWAARGIAVCADVNSEMPASHPFRRAWREVFDPRGELPPRPLELYFNAGFFGLPVACRSFLERWARFNEIARDLPGAQAERFPAGSRHPLSALDQDAFNAALTLGREPISAMGKDGMGFQAGGGTIAMVHAIGGRKPWGSFLTGQALRRRRPTPADRAFIENLDGPIAVYPWACRTIRRLDLALARALGALVGS